MTVQDTTNKFNAVGDGSTTIFPWSNIKIINTSDMTVTVDGVLQAEGVDYTVSYDANTTNGSITFFVAPANTSAILGVRAMPLEQPFDIPIDSDFDAEKIETMNDNSVLIIQDQQDKINRSLKAPASFTGDFVSEIVAQDSVVVGNDTGTGFKDSGVDVSTLNQSVADAAASAAAALVSETNAAASAVQTANDVIQTNADVVTTNANVALTNADVITTNANVALTNADVISTNADAAAAAQSALDAQVAKIEWQGVYNGATAYELNDAVEYNGSSYINIQAGAGNLPTDVAYWDLMASKGERGDDGTGTMDSFNIGNGISGSGGNQVGDGDTISLNYASKAEAEAGTNTVKAMNPLRTKEAISALAGTGLPVGAIVMLPRNTIPDGMLECNGATFNPATYPELQVYLNGITLPDLRGEFIRGWDNGRGIDSGRSLASFQNWQLSRHNHTLTAHNDFGGQGQSVANSNQNTQPAVSTSFSGGSSNSNESRPRNIALIFAIKAE